MATDGGQELLDQGIARLRELLGEGWRVDRAEAAAGELLNAMAAALGAVEPDAVVTIEDPGGQSTTRMLVEAAPRVTPAKIKQSVLPKLRLLQSLLGEAPALVIAPWISPQTRELLTEFGIGYLDFTGNTHFRLNRPAIVLRTSGAARDPYPSDEGHRRLAGPRAGRLVRLLVDVTPPYRAADLAAVANISPPYVSRLLATMEEHALIERRGRDVVSVDWVRLLKVRAAETDLLRANPPVSMLAPNGIPDALEQLAELLGPSAEVVAVTGPVAAAHVAPVAVGGQLMIYVPPGDIDAHIIGDELGLLPAQDAADVLLLRASDHVVFNDRRFIDGVPHVALSQLALDCLSGPGRMPAQGIAVMETMERTEEQWRRARLVGSHSQRLRRRSGDEE